MNSALITQILLAVLAMLVLVAAYGDFRRYTIPNAVSLAICMLYPLYVLFSPSEVDWLAAVGVAAATLVAGFILFNFGVMGGGDVKMIAALSIWAGPAYFAEFLVVTALAGGVLGLIVLVAHKIAGRRSWEGSMEDAAGPATDSTGRGIDARQMPERAKAMPVPYGVAIAVGAGLLLVRLAANSLVA